MKTLANLAPVKKGATPTAANVFVKSLATVALLMASATASAQMYTFSFSDGVNTGNGNLTVLDNHATGGTLTVTGGSDIGTYALLTGGPAYTDSPSGLFYFDNSVFASINPILSDAGLLFYGTVGNPATPSGYNYEANLFSNDLNNGSYSYSFWTAHYKTASDALFYVKTDNVIFNVTAIPEPEEYVLMLIGSGLIAFRLRCRAKATA
jgi:hypothetical protein